MTRDSAVDAKVILQRGLALHRQGELDEARALYRQALLLQPDYFDALHCSGVLEFQTHHLQVAAELLAKAILIRPQSAEALNDYGNTLLGLGRIELAVESYDSALELKPNYPEAFYNRGSALFDLKMYEAAIASYDRAVALKLDYAEAYYNRGTALLALGRADAALASYDDAIRVKPDYLEAHFNRGLILQDRLQLDAALRSFNAAISINPGIAEPHYKKSTVLLLLGDFEAGLPEYEWRRQCGEAREPVAYGTDIAAPIWHGQEPLSGKTMLVRNEQGLGDTIQFCRYARVLADLGAKVILTVQPSLLTLLRDVEGASMVVAAGSALPEFDYHCPLLSLPLALKTTLDNIPSPGRYLHTDEARRAAWKVRLGESTAPRIGLTWSGNQARDNRVWRNIPLSEMLRHLPAGFQYYCLQKHVLDSDRRALDAHAGILHVPDDLEFPATAALCDLMDVILTTDTSIAHLSGALNRPTWVLLPFHCDWRWLLGRQDSPWYPSARLFRQSSPGDWAGVLRRVGDELLATFKS